MSLWAQPIKGGATVTLNFHELDAFLQTNWGWAAGLAGSMFGLTLLAGGLLHQARKEEIRSG